MREQQTLDSLVIAGLVIGGAALLLLRPGILITAGSLRNGDFSSGANNSPDYWWTYNPAGHDLFTWTPGSVSIEEHTVGPGSWGQTVAVSSGGPVHVSASVVIDAVSLNGVDPGVGIVIDTYDGAPGIGQLGRYLGGLDTVKRSTSGMISGVFQLRPETRVINFNLVMQNMDGTATFSNASLT